MKKLSQFVEARTTTTTVAPVVAPTDVNTEQNAKKISVTSDVNPGNGLGVTNHYTPIENIMIMVKNIFATRLGVVVAVGEDGVSLKLHSSYFTTKEEVNKVLYNPIYNGTMSVATYIIQQGLPLIKMINVGQFWVVYFCPDDIKTADKHVCPTCGCDPCICGEHEGDEDSASQDGCTDCYPCEQMTEANIYEAEMDTFITEDDEEELQDVTKAKINELISSKDKVKAAKQLEILVAQQMELPREYYFAGVKDKEGEESIALRWKYTKTRAHNRTGETIRSLVNIYGFGKDGVWVQDFVKDCMFQLPDDVKKLIENFLELIGAEKTNDPAVFSLDEKEKETERPEKKKEEEKDKDEDKDKEDISSKSDEKEDDTEDSNSRGEDEGDDLLG